MRMRQNDNGTQETRRRDIYVDGRRACETGDETSRQSKITA